MINNSRGNILSLGLLITLLSVSLFSKVILTKLNSIAINKSIMRNHLCAKKSHYYIHRHNKKINRNNKLITTSNLVIAASASTGNLALLKAARLTKKASQRYQDLEHISFMKNISSLFKSGCLFTPSVYKTSSVTKGLLKLKRSPTGRVLKRRRRWRYKSVGKKNTITSSFLNGKSLIRKTKDLIL